MLENGFVLLNSHQFDIRQLLNDLKTDWGIVGRIEQQDSSYILTIGEFLCAWELIF